MEAHKTFSFFQCTKCITQRIQLRIFILNILTFLFLISTVSCRAQQLMKTIADAPELVKNKDSFIGSPLKKLLSEIKLPIKAAIASPEMNDPARLPSISFHFIDRSEYNTKSRWRKSNNSFCYT